MPTTRALPLIIAGLAALLLVGVALIAAPLAAEPDAAQPGATARALAEQAAATAQAELQEVQQAAATAQADVGGAALTARAAAEDTAATARADAQVAAATARALADQASDDIVATLNAIDPAVFAATAQAAATAAIATAQTFADQNAESIQLTATALFGEVTSALGQIPEELLLLVEELAARGNVVYDPAANQLVITVFIEEAQVNTLLDSLASTAGYSAETIEADMQPGQVVVTWVDESGVAPITFTLTYQLVVRDGQLSVVLVDVRVNSAPVRTDEVPGDLLATIEESLIATTLESVAVLASAGYALNVDSAVVTADGILLTVAVPLS
ncbi:MAG: hypothetical protein GYB67_00715 [Chloroflexi bacterium]|nr:hypothetical protein [Chloroflexota bacterium]